MKITLDVKALEALIAGNSEAEVELRNCVVQEFAKRHFKAVANDPIFKGMIENQLLSIRMNIEEEMKTIFVDLRKDGYGKVTRESFKKEVINKIHQEADHYIDLQISKKVQELVNTKLDDLTSKVNIYCDSMINKYTTKALDEMVDNKFRALLAAMNTGKVSQQ
jgi:hypothetical protein